MHKIEAEHFTQMTFFSPRKKKQKRVRDDFKAFLVEGARFTSIEQYPIIEPWMIPDTPPPPHGEGGKAQTARDGPAAC